MSEMEQTGVFTQTVKETSNDISMGRTTKLYGAREDEEDTKIWCYSMKVYIYSLF